MFNDNAYHLHRDARSGLGRTGPLEKNFPSVLPPLRSAWHKSESLAVRQPRFAGELVGINEPPGYFQTCPQATPMIAPSEDRGHRRRGFSGPPGALEGLVVRRRMSPWAPARRSLVVTSAAGAPSTLYE